MFKTIFINFIIVYDDYVSVNDGGFLNLQEFVVGKSKEYACQYDSKFM